MSIRRLTQSIMAIYRNPWGRVALLSVYYLGIILGLIGMYGRGDLTPPDFVYQGF